MFPPFVLVRRRPGRPASRAAVGLCVLAVVTVLAGCTGPSTMTDKQKEAYELRRYCEKNPEDVVRCLGFLGFH